MSKVKKDILNFISITERQQASDPVLYTLRDGVDQLISLIEAAKRIDDDFIYKWKSSISFAYRAFEGHPFLDTLYELDKQIILMYNC